MKKARPSPRQTYNSINFRLPPEERDLLYEAANRWTDGNVSAFLKALVQGFTRGGGSITPAKAKFDGAIEVPYLPG